MNNNKRVYLDNSATTQVLPEVVKEMQPYFSEIYGNASSLHYFGREAKKALDAARAKIATLLNAAPEEIFFTGCGTESDNLAIFGVVSAQGKKGHLITTKVEHHAVLYSFQHLEKLGYEVTYLDPDKSGAVSAEDFKKAVRDDTIFASIMYANNEVGTLEPVEEIAAALKEINAGRKNKIYFHTDAVQAAGKIKLDVQKLGVDLLSISGHKFGAPKGVGVLYVRKGVKIEPMTFGGGHENGLRPGTENVPSIAGMAKAFELAVDNIEQHHKHILSLRESLKKGIVEKIPEVVINGSGNNAVANILNVSFHYIEGEALLLKLDMKGIAASTGSACATGEPSHVLSAMCVDPVAAQGAVRFSFGHSNTQEEVDYVLSVLPEMVESLRAMSPVWRGKK